MNDVVLKGFERLQALGVERLTAIRNALTEGKSPQTVARMIQDEWGEFKDVQLKTLGQQIRRYKMQYVETKLPDVRDDLSNAYRGQLDTLACMEDLARIQKHRLELAYGKEKIAQMLLSQTRNEVRELANLYKDIQELRFQLGLDVLNVSPATQSKMGVRVTTPDGSVVEAAMQTNPLEQRSERALAILDKYQAKIVSEQ